jgi:hypothetical protein
MKTIAIACVAILSLASTIFRQASGTSGYFTASDGVKIHYLTAGNSGSWVVLIHG